MRKFLSFFNLIRFFLKNLISKFTFFFNCYDNSFVHPNFIKESNLKLRVDKLKSNLSFNILHDSYLINLSLLSITFLVYISNLLTTYNLLILLNLINFCF